MPTRRERLSDPELRERLRNPPPSDKCPRCGQRITLDERGLLRPHAKNPSLGAGSRKCSGGGKRPEPL